MKNTSCNAPRHTLLCIAIALTLNIPCAQGAVGGLNSSFNGGSISTSVAGNDEARAVAVQADGKILVSGYAGAAAPHFFLLNRYNTNGTLDTSFSGDGVGGTYVLPVPNQVDSYATALAIQSNGQILQAGYSNYDFAVVRYNTSDGLRDTAFGGGDGIVTTNLGDIDIATSMALQPDGKILVAGYTGYLGDNDMAMVRYNSDGSLDTTFNSNGTLIISNPNNNDIASSIVLQTDGKILIAGSSAYYDQQSNEPPYIELRRYNSNGTIDTAFGTNGIVSYYGHQAGSEAYALALQADGKILVSGYADNGSAKIILLLRYNSNGTLDTGFDTDGVVVSSVSYDGARALALQPDGKILIGGDLSVYNGISNTWDFAVRRFNSNGTADSSFGSSGLFNTEVSGDDDHLYALAVNPNGSIIAAGSGYMDFSNDNTRNGDNDFVVVSILANDANNDGTAEAWDLTPDNFLFSDAGNVTVSTVQTSASVQITGLATGVSAPVTITGGEYAIGSNAFTSEPGNIQNNTFISVRHTASATVGVTTNTVLTVGGMHATNSVNSVLGTRASDSYSSTSIAATNPAPTTTTTTSGGGGALNWPLLLLMLPLLWRRDKNS